MCPLVWALYSWVRGVLRFEDMPFGGLEILHPISGDLLLKDVNTESAHEGGRPRTYPHLLEASLILCIVDVEAHGLQKLLF